MIVTENKAPAHTMEYLLTCIDCPDCLSAPLPLPNLNQTRGYFRWRSYKGMVEDLAREGKAVIQTNLYSRGDGQTVLELVVTPLQSTS